MTTAPWLVARASADADALERALDPVAVATLDLAPASPWDGDGRAALERALSSLAAPAGCAGVVVCTWPPAARTGPAITLDPDEFAVHVEHEIACWAGVLARAVELCADGGSVVAVVELPAALDVSGHVTTVVVGQALVNFARSLATGEGKRGVRVNVVTTELFTAPAVPLGVAPPLPAFPGSAAREVAGAVRMLLSDDACGVTGTVVRADCGRSA